MLWFMFFILGLVINVISILVVLAVANRFIVWMMSKERRDMVRRIRWVDRPWYFIKRKLGYHKATIKTLPLKKHWPVFKVGWTDNRLAAN